jgi:hypothetical protein
MKWGSRIVAEAVPGADLWAWLFVHATELTEVPDDLSPGPCRDALELANQANFTPEELQSYERTRDEIRQVLEIAAARWAEAKAAGFAEGETAGFTRGETAGFAKGKAEAVIAILAARGIPVSAEARGSIEACKVAAVLDRWIARATTAGSVEEVIAAAEPRG